MRGRSFTPYVYRIAVHALIVAAVCGCVLVVSSAAQAAASDAQKSDGTPWRPRFEEYSRGIFQALDSSAVAPHVKLPFENLTPRDRPPHFSLFLWLGLVLLPTGIAAAAVVRRRQLRQFFREWRYVPPDDIVWMAVIMAVGLGLRVVASLLLPLHGSEWGSVEHKAASELPDIIFNGYEVLTNPPLLNLIEHFVFKVSDAPFVFRFPVVLFGLGMIWGARNVGRELFSRRAGIIAAVLVSVNCGLIIWSATMRAYLPMATFVVAAIPAAFRLAEGRGRDRDAVLLAVFGSLAAWTHYIALIWLVGLYALIVLGRRRDIRGLVTAASAGIMTFLSFLPLIPFFMFDIGAKQGATMPPGYGMDLLAVATGLAGGLGALLVLGLVVARFFRFRGALWLSLLMCEYLIFNIVTIGFIHWEVPYSVGLSAVVMIIAAGVFDGLRNYLVPSVLLLALLATTHVLVLSEPSDNVKVADATRPFLWRSVSNRMFATQIRMNPSAGLDGEGRTVVLVTPAYEAEPYLFRLGPVTAEQAGVEPVVGRNFDEMRFDVADGPDGRRRSYTIIGFERYWSWHLGQWPELDRFKKRFGSFWYARLQQNCETGTGFTLSTWDCAWLQKNCQLVESNANDELYLCGADSG